METFKVPSLKKSLPRTAIPLVLKVLQLQNYALK